MFSSVPVTCSFCDQHSSSNHFIIYRPFKVVGVGIRISVINQSVWYHMFTPTEIWFVNVWVHLCKQKRSIDYNELTLTDLTFCWSRLIHFLLSLSAWSLRKSLQVSGINCFISPLKKKNRLGLVTGPESGKYEYVTVLQCFTTWSY